MPSKDYPYVILCSSAFQECLTPVSQSLFPVSLGAFLIAQSAAEEDVSNAIALPVAPQRNTFLRHVTVAPQQAPENDTPPRGKRPRKKA